MGWISRGRLELKGPTRGLLYGEMALLYCFLVGERCRCGPCGRVGVALDGRRDLVPLDFPQRKVRIGGRR
jgi:hypothetical protein